MVSYSINDKITKKDSWVKELKRTFNPESLAELVKKRIESPRTTGPFLREFDKESSIDILTCFMSEDVAFKAKIEPAIGLLLYKMNSGKMEQSHELLIKIFNLIHDNNLQDCQILVYNWLKENKSIFEDKDPKWKLTYREGMMAYAQVQPRNNKNIEEWWFDVWNGGTNLWWPPAFLGLRIQNPTRACNELPRLIERNLETVAPLLVGLWYDKNSRTPMEVSMRVGIENNTGWGGFAFNSLYGKLSETDQIELLKNMQLLNQYLVTD